MPDAAVAARSRDAAADGPWWGAREVPLDHTAAWRVGPLEVWIRRRRHEWRLAHRAVGDPMDATVDLAAPVAEVDVPDDVEIRRFAAHEPVDAVVLTPHLADRPVVARPEVPFALLPGDAVSLYVSLPTWLLVTTAETPPRAFLELPTVRLSDSWFGPDTITGEHCYASPTKARLHLENVPVLPYRAITEVRLENESASELVLERIKLPVPQLALWADAAGRLWTQAVGVRRREAGADEVRIVPGAPPQLAGAEQVAPPRLRGAPNVFVRALDALLR